MHVHSLKDNVLALAVVLLYKTFDIFICIYVYTHICWFNFLIIYSRRASLVVYEKNVLLESELKYFFIFIKCLLQIISTFTIALRNFAVNQILFFHCSSI